MIFVTVGTHEQQFNRLVEYMDSWAANHQEEVLVQTGFSTYEPSHCRWKKLFGYQEMEANIKSARIVVTHGGPSSFIAPLQIGKIPIVIPRKKDLNEHVNNHQLTFCQEVADRYKNIIVVKEIDELGDIIDRYDEIIGGMKSGLKSNNERFCSELSEIVDQIMKK